MDSTEYLQKDVVRVRYPGVSLRGKSICIHFVWPIKSARVRHITLKGLTPTEKNFEYAAALVRTIKFEINIGVFSWSKHFPDHKLANIELKKNGGYSIKDLLEEYLGDYAKQRKEGLTLDNYTYRARRFLEPEFGHIPLNEFSAGHVHRWAMQKMNDGISKKTLKSYIAPLRSAMKMAQQLEYIKGNPFRDFVWPEETREMVKRNNERRKKTKLDIFTIEEINRLVNACSREQEKNIIEFGFWTGMRPEELFALHWSDIDFVGNKAEVNKAKIERRGYACVNYDRPYGDEIKGIKTGELGERTLDLLPCAVKALHRQKQWTFMQKKFVFHNHYWNKPWENTGQFRNRFEEICLKAGVRYRRPYMMRHTYASMMLKAGEDEAWVATQLGHVDTTMIRQVYRQFIPECHLNGGYRFKNDWGTGVLKDASSGQT